LRCLPIHYERIGTTKLLEHSFIEERHRGKVILRSFTETSCLKLSLALGGKLVGVCEESEWVKSSDNDSDYFDARWNCRMTNKALLNSQHDVSLLDLRPLDCRKFRTLSGSPKLGCH